LLSELQFETVMARLKEALRAESYAEVGRMLELSTSAYANRKRANSLPLDKIVSLAHSRNISLEWLFFGEGEGYRDARTILKPAPEVDKQLLAGIFMALSREFWSEEGKMPHSIMIDVGRLAGLAGHIYNRVVHVENGALRLRMIKDEARELAQVSKIMEGDPSKAFR
jgi:hypothetical protein